jgi:hypothetical protein
MITFPSEEWTVQEELFTRRAKFTVRPFPNANLRWVLRNLPGDAHMKPQANGTTALELENIPGFHDEEWMPPEDWIKGRAGFFYQMGPPVASATWWDEVAKEAAKRVDEFLGDLKKLKPLVANIVSPGDPPETKLRKLYARAQEIRSLSDQPARTEQDSKRDNLKDNKNAEDVLNHGYAYFNQINLVLVALARAAGFDSAPLLVKSRDTGFFWMELLDEDQLDAMVVWVRAGNKDYFLDPATRYCSFGLLPWPETSTSGIALTLLPPPIGLQSHWLVNTPKPDWSVVRRKAQLQMDAEGGAEGALDISFSGSEALERRLLARNLDTEGRKKNLEEEVKGWIPEAVTVELRATANWEESQQPLHAEFRLKLANYATSTGRRLLFRAGLLEGGKIFQAPTRKLDIYFPEPLEEVDDVTWTQPVGYRLTILPEKVSLESMFGNYSLLVDTVDGVVHANRRLTIAAGYHNTSYYSATRSHFNSVRQGDEAQIILDRMGGPNEVNTK